MSTYHVIFSKATERNINHSRLDTQISVMCAKASHFLQKHGFTLVKTDIKQVGTVGDYSFHASIILRSSGSGEGLQEVIDCMSSVVAVNNWTFLKSFRDEGSETISDYCIQPSDNSVEEEKIDLGENAVYFDHLYERDAQISVVLSALEAAQSSRFALRFHSVLEGPPGCGKTAITAAVEKMVGPERVIKFDGPSCTKAGIENFFLDGEEDVGGPKVMIFEEIEKAETNAHKVLLSMLDSRGEVRKTTGDDGQRVRDVKVLCIATVNDMNLFRKLYSGALASRFTHTIHCPRPSRKCLGQILDREIDKVGGNKAWIEPALDYVLHVEKTTDPRRAIAVCLSGRDKLLTGSYQKALNAINKTRIS